MNTPKYRLKWFAGPLFAVIFIITGGFSSGQSGPIPSPRYYRGVDYLNRGDIVSAIEHYQEDLKLAIRFGSMRWIDSICYYAMLGEAYYMRADYTEALKYYNMAIALQMQYPNWLSRVEFTLGAQTTARNAVAWGPGLRTTSKSFFPQGAQMLVGDNVTEERLRQGGAIAQMKMIKIDPLEILNCLALSIRRRVEILGPLAKFDPTSQRIVQTFSTRAVSPNHWSVVWLDVLFGLSLEGMGKEAEATKVLGNALTLRGTSDHTLTSTALLELGKLNLQSGKGKEASAYYHEASIAAMQYGDYLLVEESLRGYAAARKTYARKEKDQVLYMAHQWSKTQKNLRLLLISLSEEITENLIVERNFKAAGNGLRLVDRMMDNRGLRFSRYADRWNYLSALLAYADGQSTQGDQALAKVVEGMQLRSLWYFQVGTLNKLARAGGFTSSGAINLKSATELYETLLREPNDIDWACSPMDALTIQVAIPRDAYEGWFLLLLERDLKENAFEIADRIRREHFFAHMTLGSRLFSLRFLLSASPELLSDAFKLNRQEILFEFPEFDTMNKQVAEIKTLLFELPTVPTNEDDKKKQKELLEKLEQISQQQESYLRYIAASRIRIPVTFPPRKTVLEIQSILPEETSLLAFITAGGTTFGTMITKDILDIWPVGSSDLISVAVASYLKTLGNIEANRQWSLKDLNESKWQEESKKLLETILGDRNSGGKRFSVVFKHLVIVPDQSLWYLPFESLCVPSGEKEVIPLLLVPGLTIRYAPTVGLAFPDRVGRSSFSETTVVPGVLFPKESEKIQKEALTRLSRSVQKMELFQQGSIKVSSGILAPRLKRLIVLDEIMGNKNNSYSWVPFTASGTGNNDVMSWSRLPWGAPDLILLPGFRSAAENSLKNASDGNEFFMPLMVLEASGSKSILMSRWRTGGRSAYDLTEAFMKNLPEHSAADAWKTTVENIQKVPMVPAEEPRLRKPGQSDIIPNLVHPFFWSGYMLVDRGEPGDYPMTDEVPENTAPTPAPSPDSKMSEPAMPDSNKKAKGNTDTPDNKRKTDSEKTSPVDGKKTDSDQKANDKQASGPVIVIKPNESTPAPVSEKKSDTKTGATQSNEGKSESDKPAIPPSAGGKRPVTDEDLKKADEEGDDFYSKEK